MSGLESPVVNQRGAWVADAVRWNRRLSIGIAIAAGLASFIVGWAITIKFGSWIGVFLGWWPAMLVASLVALIAGRTWPIVAVLAVLAVAVLLV